MSLLLDDTNISGLFFRNALMTGSLAHGYVLKGQHLNRMYQTALDVAKVLNCENRRSPVEPCGECSPCKWIAQNSHPAVLTVSRLTYLVGDNGADLSMDDLEKLAKKPPQTMIKTEQMARLIHQLGVSSPYYRVVIFTDAEEVPANQDAGITPPYDWQGVPGREDKRFQLRPLHRGIFTVESANRFLKTLEEPPPKTLFFFLTDSEDNLMETIVSRCQTVPFIGAAESASALNLSDAALELFSQWVERFQFPKVVDVYPMIQQFQSTMVDGEGYTPEQALSAFQKYLRQTYLANQHFLPYTRYRDLQKALEQAVSMIHSKTNTDQVLQQLFWHLTAKTTPQAPFR